jgi:Protein of unknown function (DUF4435)
MENPDEFLYKRENSFSAQHQFLLNLNSQAKNDIHAFFEGRDDRSFYMNFLHRFSKNQEVYTYLCKNKKGVYEAYRMTLKVHYSAITLFFVDKDHSDVLGEECEQAPNIYVTDLYSIENYLVSVYMLERVWKELFRFSGIMEFNSRHRAKFEEELNRFYEFTTPLMAWVICLKRQGKSPIINNISISKFFTITKELTLEWKDEAQPMGKRISILENLCGEKTPEDKFDIRPIIDYELLYLHPKSYIRGKLELEFFVKFINTLLDSLTPLVTTKTRLTEDNALEILGPRALIPQSLEKFLQMHLTFLSLEKQE